MYSKTVANSGRVVVIHGMPLLIAEQIIRIVIQPIQKAGLKRPRISDISVRDVKRIGGIVKPEG